MSEVHDRFSEISEELFIASGSVQTDLIAISASYLEAKESLKKYIYYGSECPDNTSVLSVPQNRIGELLDSLQETLEKGNIQDLELLCGRIVETIDSNAPDIRSLVAGCSDLIDILVAKLYIVPGNDAEQNTKYASYYNELEKRSSRQEISDYMQTVLSSLTAALTNEYNRSHHKIISAAKEYVRLHYNDSNLSIHQIADSIGITDAYLSSIFAEYTGENLVTYLNRFRVDMAKELLLNTKIIIKDVGYKTGFYTVQNFNRVFKRFTGMTPGEFRKNML